MSRNTAGFVILFLLISKLIMGNSRHIFIIFKIREIFTCRDISFFAVFALPGFLLTSQAAFFYLINSPESDKESTLQHCYAITLTSLTDGPQQDCNYKEFKIITLFIDK